MSASNEVLANPNVKPLPEGGDGAVWITWEKHTRTRSICRETNIPLVEITPQGPKPFRYFALLHRTVLALKRFKGRAVIVQNPSLVLALFANVYCRLAGRRCIVDCHNAGIRPFDGRYRVLNALAKLSIRLSSVTIVTNPWLARQVEGFGGNPLVMPDPLPEMVSDKNVPLSRHPLVVFICTWAADEPYEQVIAAAAELQGVEVAITGRYDRSKAKHGALRVPENVRLTGFLSDEEFHDLLRRSWVIMDLTTREDCLVCGAYEGTALEKPLVLSDSRALRNYFRAGVVFAPNTEEGIRSALSVALAKLDVLREEIKALKCDLAQSWPEYRRSFLEVLKARASSKS